MTLCQTLTSDFEGKREIRLTDLCFQTGGQLIGNVEV